MVAAGIEPNGRGSKLTRRVTQVLVHVSTYQGNPFWNSGFLSHSQMPQDADPRRFLFGSLFFSGGSDEVDVLGKERKLAAPKLYFLST